MKDDLHSCIVEFETRKIDECSGKGYNRCSGHNPMILVVWYQDKDGIEEYFDNWAELQVNYCPFCGLKSENE